MFKRADLSGPLEVKILLLCI